MNDVERLARLLCVGASVNPEAELVAEGPLANMPFGRYHILTPNAPRVLAWQFFTYHAELIINELRQRPLSDPETESAAEPEFKLNFSDIDEEPPEDWRKRNGLC